jgi:HlyD family secretion protein
MKKRVAVFLALAIAALPLAACAGGNGEGVPTAKATRGDVRITVSVSGNLNAPDDRFLSFKLPGTIKEILVEKGDTVGKGDILARLDTEDMERNVELARSTLRQAQAQYKIAENQLRQTIYPHYYSSYVIDVPGTWMALEQAIESVEGARALMEAGNVSEANVALDDVLDEIAEAQRDSESRQWEFPIAVKVMELQREAAAAALDAAGLNLAASQDMLEDATIVAPFSGIIAAVPVKQGDTLTSMNYFNPAIHIIDPTNLEMTGLIDEMDIADITLGQKAIVTMDALAGTEVVGAVTYISAAAMIQAGVVMYEATISLTNPDSAIKDGMSATADIVREEHEDVLVLPAGAVMKGKDGQDVVYVWTEGKDLRMQDITVGLRSGRMVEILSGLKEGEIVSLEATK